MKKLLLILSFSMIALLDWAQVQNACFSSRNDISFSRGTSNSRGIVQGDFDEDGLLDIVTTTYGSGPRFSFQKGLGNGKFGSPITGGLSGSSTLDIEKADFNGDGKLDIVYANLLGVHIYTGQGNGSFDSLTFLPLASAKYLTLGDFNEDGAIDIVASTSGVTATANVLFLGTPGNPTLFTAVSDPTFPKPAAAGFVLALETADMNNDNHLDIVFLLSGGVRVYLNQPASLGNFTPQTASGNITGTPNYMTVVDLNNDGNKDVVVSRSTSNLINVFFGNGLGSVGTTAASISYPTENYPCGLKHYDINQDGFMDIVVLNSYSSTMSIYYGSASGALTLHQTTQCPGAPRVLVVDQFTADVHADIVTTQADFGYINSFVGNASNNYMQTNLFDVAASPSSSFAGDFNGDGKQDVAITHSTLDQVQIWLGNGAGGFTAGAILPTGTEPVFITGGDLNGNGTIDLVVVNKTSNDVTVFYGSGTGTFPSTALLTAGTAPVQAKIGNLNGDANLDIVVVNSGSSNFSTFLASGPTSFSAAVNTVTAASPGTLAIGDFDADGKQDLAIGFSVATIPKRFPGDGAGGFGAGVNITSAALPYTAMEAADLDGDGDADLVVANTSSIYKIHFPLSTGAITNSLVATSLNLGINHFGSGESAGIKIVDVNNDGKLDVVAVYANGGTPKNGTMSVAVATAFGVNAGYVLTPNSLSFATEITPSGLAMADFNSDGRIDAVVPNAGSNSFTLHLNTTPVINAVGPTTFCNGNSVTLNGTAASQWYEWSPTNETTQNITATTDAIYTLTSSSSWSDWCSAVSDTLKVTVTPGPAATTISSPSTVICGPGSITLTSTAGAGTYQWYKDGVAISGATSITYAATTSGIYTVRVVSGGCSSDHSNQITISVAQTPVITAGGPTTFCAGGSVVLTSDVASNITWSPGGQTTPSITVTTSGTYSVTNNVGGCPSLTSNSIIVTVTPAPPAPTISPSGTVNLCTGQSVTLVSSASTGNVWSTTETTQNITVNTAGTYTVQQVSGGCSSLASAPVTVVIHNLPATPTITAGGSTTFCAGGSVVLTAPASSSYLWSPGGQTTQSITVSTAGSYSVVVTNAAGCTSAPSNVIPVTVNALPATPTITAGGPTTFCAGGSVVLTAPASTSYLWSPGNETTQSITVTAGGSYSVVVTNAAGCSSAASTAVPVTVNALPATPTITAGGSTTFCTGGSVVLTAPASSSYLWSPGGQTTQSITVTTSGSHSVVVTNAAGCTSATSNVIPVTVNPLPATPTITAGGPTTFCAGGSVILTAPVSASYLWSNGLTTQTISVTTSGSYSVQVGTPGCMSVASNVIPVTVNALPATPTITAGGSTNICAGGSVVLTAPAATTYLWSPNGETTQSITVSTAGSYSVVVTNAAGCTSATSNVIPVTVNPLPATPTITAGGSTTFCAGGSVVLTAPASTSYLWSPNGETTQSITVSTAGSYSVVVTNAAGCTSATSNIIPVTVNPLPATPTITAGGPTTFCAGGSVVLTAPTSTSYLWSNSAVNQSITVTASDNLSAVVTDANGCTSLPSNVIPVTVNALPATPTITAGGSTTFCAGGSVVLTAPAAASYLWSPGGQTTQSITVTTSGSYSVVVSSGAGCASATSNVIPVTVNPLPATPTITAGGPTTFCAGGSVVLTSTAGPGYLWSPGGQTTQSITVTTSGNYSVKLVSGAGCESLASNVIPVTVNALPATPTITAGGPTTFCAGGSVVLTAPASTSYLWSPGNETTQSITVTAGGSYSVVVSNAAGCSSAASTSVPVTVNALPATPTITAGGPTTFCAGGSVVLTAPASTSYLWSPGGQTTQTITVTTSGSYSVVVTNAAGCSSAPSNVIPVTVNPLPATPTITAGGPTTFCAGGSVVLTAPTSTTYSWSNGATTQSITVIASDNLSAVVTDANGCTSLPSNVIPVTVNPLPATPTITAGGPTTFCAGGSVVLTAPAAASYLWSPGGQTTQSITVTTSGSYSVVVSSGAGCASATSNVIPVTVNALPATPTITAGGPTTFCAGGSVVLTAPVSTSYLWTPGGQTTQSITVTTTGSHSVKVTDANGCTSLNSVAVPVTVHANPTTPTITAGGPTTFCDGGSVVLTAPPATSYLWSTGAVTQSITVTTSDNISVQVTNANGCTSVMSVVVPVTVNPIPTAPTITAGGPTTFCSGGSVTLTSSAATNNAWSTGAPTQSITVNTTGVYTVNTTVNGCTSPNATQTITVNSLPATPTITASGSTTFCVGDFVTLSAPTSTSYLWFPGGQTTQSINVTTSGSYSVQITNVNGCTSAMSVAVPVTVNALPATPTITVGGATTFCAGGSVTLTAPTSTSYLWSNGATTQSINVTLSGSYTVKVKNAAGCESLSSAAVDVTVNPLPAAPTVTAGGPVSFCIGGSVVLSSTPGTSYIWSNGAGNVQDITVTTNGTYTAQITDGNGCTSLASNAIGVTVYNLPTAPIITPSGSTTFCDGNSINLTSSPGTTYLWSTGETTQTITVTTSGSYWVKRTNTNGCESPVSATTIITVNPIPTTPTITASGATAFCSGGNVVLTSSANTGNTWSTGPLTQSITVSSSGTYSVTVTENGCTSAPASQTVTVFSLPATPTITAGGPTTFCIGDAVTLTSSAAFSYEWSTGATTQSIVVTTAGNYSVKVINANGCSSAFSTAVPVTVNPLPAAPSITATGLTTFCQGGSTILTSSAGSTYLWSTGQTTQSITVSVAGSYWVKITNANGCESPASVPTVVSVNPLPAAPVVTNTGATTFCIGGSVNLTSSTGTSYLWSGGLGTNQTITVTTSGTYSVQVYDANGCLSPPSADVTVTVNALPSTPTINASGPLTFCAGNTVDLTCQQVSTGYEWSTSATTQTITIGASGSYSVRRINANGCISAWSTPVNVIVNPIPATPTITASGATTFCQGNNVILTSSSATGNLWSNGATTQSITVTTTNTYTVTVSQSGCTSPSASQSVLVNPLPITPNITSSGATTFCSGFYVDLIAAPSGYDYNWSTGGTNQSISVSTSGAYTVSITDVNGCTSPVSAPMNVTVNPLPATPTITTSGSTTFCSGGFVTLTAPTSTGYLWSTSAPTQSINVTTSGTYTVQVTDINGCQSAQSASVTVTVNPLPPAPTITAGGPTTFCAGGSVSLSSTPGSTYTWSNSSNTQNINVNTSGTYTAQITNVNGCLSPASNPITVTVNPLPATPIISSSGSNTFCDGDFVTLTAPTASSYAWSTGEITQSINVSLTGGYTVVITDANGCMSPISAATNITVNPIPAAPSITPTGPTTFCAGNNVILNSSVTTGNLWSTNATTQSITVTASGTYTLTQTLLGCTSPSASINITVNPIPPAPIVTTSGVTTFCDGGSVSLTSSISGNITWSTSETSTSITATTSGLYTVTQTVLGCVSNPSIPVNVVVNPIPAVPTITASGLTTFCAGNTITLTSSAPTGNLWSNGSTNQSITVGTTGSYFVQVILSGCSSGTSAPSTVTVNPLPNAPTIVTGTTESICDGSSVTLTSSSTGGNTWSTGPNTQSISVSAAGSYTVQVTDGNGCTSPPSIPTIVTVNPLPAAPIISTSVAPVLCYGEQVDLTSSYPTGNIWSSGSTAPTITVSTAGSFTVTHTDANGCVSLPSTATTVVVNPIPPAPVITPVGSTTFCQGGSVDLVSSEASGNLWSNGLSTSTISPTTSGVYTVMFVDANGCSSLSSLPVVVSVLANPPAPSISAGGPTTVCQGTPVNLVSSYTSGNLWSTGSTMQSINVTTSGSYTVTYTNVNGCSSVSAPMIITVTPTSPIPTISASGSTTICEGSSVTLTSSDPSSTWSTGAGAQSITVSNSGSYFVIGNSTGCASPASAPIVVTVNPSPAVPLITPSGPTTICQGDELFLFTSASGTIQWSTGYTGPVLAISNPGTYFVNVENAYGCTSSSVLVDVVINSLPNVAMNPFATVCTNTAPFTLSNGVPSGGSYSGNGITSNVFNPAVMGPGASIVTYVYTDINGCSAEAQSIITVSNCLGIDENSKEFALYPNPTDGRFVITSEGVPMDNIVIYDAQGKMVYNESYFGLFTLEFNLNDYSNGVYYIEIISNSEVQNRMPLVINH